MLLERPDREELIRADEWLAVAQLLHEQDPAALEGLGFHGPDRDLLARLIVTLARATALEEDIKPLAESVLKRIEQLVPVLADSARSAITIAGLAEDLAQQRWFVPQDIAAPPSRESSAPQPTSHTAT